MNEKVYVIALLKSSYFQSVQNAVLNLVFHFDVCKIFHFFVKASLIINSF